MAVKRFSCTDCRLKYATKAKLNEHMKSHVQTSKEKETLSCKICSEAFTSPVQLKRHQRTCSCLADGKGEKHVSGSRKVPNTKDVCGGNSIQDMLSKMQTLLDSPKNVISSSVSSPVTKAVTADQTNSSVNIESMSLLIKNSLKPTTSKARNYLRKNVTRSQSSKVGKSIGAAQMQRVRSSNRTHKPALKKPQAKQKVKEIILSQKKLVSKETSSNSSSTLDKMKKSTTGEVTNGNVSVTFNTEIANKLDSGTSKENKSSVKKSSVSLQKRQKNRTISSETVKKVHTSGETKQNSTESNLEQLNNTVKENTHSSENVVVTKKQFTCAQCSKTFSRKYHLDRHLKLSPCSGLPPLAFPCQVCNRVYSRKDNLREHLRAHTGESQRVKKHKCDICNKAFHGQSLLTIHVRTHTGERPFLCDFCTKKFPSAGALSKHRRTHTGEKPFECPECGHKFSLKGTLKRHIRVHTGVRPHKCMYCGKQFIQIGGLKAHMFYHTGENGFKCDECNKVFNRKARLQMHKLYVHVKHRPFACEHCSKCFTRKEDLHRHAVLHTGQKPFNCPTCTKTFAIKSSLKLHLLTHTKEEPRSCHECGRAFIRKDCLLRHMRKRHRDLLDKILLDEKDEKYGDASSASSRMLGEEDLCENITELLSLLVEESTLVGFGWPNKPVDEVLEAVIRRCGHTPVCPDQYSFMDRMRENAKLLFTVVIDDNAVKTLLNNQTVDEVILHVLRLAKT